METLLINEQNYFKYSKELFHILADNMNEIAPTGNKIEDDYEFWLNNLHMRLLDGNCSIIVFTLSGSVIAYFQYSSHESTFLIEEIQIKSDFQIHYNILGKIIKLLPTIIPSNTLYIEAYANKDNKVSMQILSKAGFEIVGTNKSGKSHLYRGDFSSLAKRFRMGSF